MLVSKYVGNHSRNYYIRPSSLENEKKKTPPFYVSNFFAEGLLAIFGCMNEKKNKLPRPNYIFVNNRVKSSAKQTLSKSSKTVVAVI